MSQSRAEKLGDINCDGSADIVDSLLISQYSVDTRTGLPECPLASPADELNIAVGDFNGDGAVNVVDSLTIASCSVGNVIVGLCNEGNEPE